jgi:two-component sensor histidine kinase
MTAPDDESTSVGELLESDQLADALESDRFKTFLDHVPFAVAVSELQPQEHITYANLEFERLSGQPVAELRGKFWTSLVNDTIAADGRRLSKAVVEQDDHIGTFTIAREDGPIEVDAWSHVILDDQGTPAFRLVALARLGGRGTVDVDELEQQVREKDTLLKELQHRVKNNLQMITALIRLEARNKADDEDGKVFERLAGRVHALALLYDALSSEDQGDGVDLGAYIGQVASAVMLAHAVEGIRLDLKVDTWPVSVNVAMPTGLVINELLTNALKHAFNGRDGGSITVQALVDDSGCRVTVADDGVGLPEGLEWPNPGKLSALIVQSLKENAHATLAVESSPGRGVSVTIFFARAAAAPETA